MLCDRVGHLPGDSFANRCLSIVAAELQLYCVNAVGPVTAISSDDMAAGEPGLFLSIERIRMHLPVSILEQRQETVLSGMKLLATLFPQVCHRLPV